jgi:hypothetical protein
MLTLDQLIDKIEASMTSQIDREILMAGVQKAQERMAEIVGEAFLQKNRGAVQTIPGDIAIES